MAVAREKPGAVVRDGSVCSLNNLCDPTCCPTCTTTYSNLTLDVWQGCNGMVVVAGGSDGKHTFNVVEVYNASTTTETQPMAKPVLPTALMNPVLVCVANRYVVVAGGSAGSSSGCGTKVCSTALRHSLIFSNHNPHSYLFLVPCVACDTVYPPSFHTCLRWRPPHPKHKQKSRACIGCPVECIAVPCWASAPTQFIVDLRPAPAPPHSCSLTGFPHSHWSMYTPHRAFGSVAACRCTHWTR